MKINPVEAHGIYKSFNSEKGHKQDYDARAIQKPAETRENADRVEISEKGADILEGSTMAQRAAAPVPKETGLRADKVEQIKKLVRSGEYDVSGRDVAASILRGRVIDKSV